MYELTVETTFSAAHCIRGYDGACENLHGHNWKVEAKITAGRLDPLGMVMDFKDLKASLKGIIERLDHMYLNEVPPFDTENATAENIARYVYTELSGMIDDGNRKLVRIKVWESETAAASYSAEPAS